MKPKQLSRRRFLGTSSALAATALATTQQTDSASAQTTPDRKYLILACDGGGIRGLVTALLLNQLNTDHPSFLGQTYLNAGTSTGGIISLALACGIAPEQLVKLYSNDGAQIFTLSPCRSENEAIRIPRRTPRYLRGTLGESWWQFFLKYIEEIICPWYGNAALKSLLETTLGEQASATLNSLVDMANPRYVLVNTLQLCNAQNIWTPLQLTNLPNLPGNTSGETLVIDAAMSTGAAPMYFPPYEHPAYGYCADGGLFANNPSTVALTSLIASGVPIEHIWMLSLDTGNTQNCYPPSIVNQVGASNFGPIYWAWPVSQPDPPVQGQPYTPSLPLMGAVFDGTAQIDTYYCSRLLPDRYKRANVPLSQPVALDDYSPTAITTMTDSTTAYIQTSPEWADIKAWITTNFA
jgi:hypothetical protein